MAAVDYFLKIDGIEGESTDSKHKNEIDIATWSWGETNAGTSAHGGGRGAGKVVMQDFSFTKQVDKSSPKLFLHCATGKHIKEVLFVARKAGTEQQEYHKIKLHHVLVSSLQMSGGSGDDVASTEQISFSFAKIEQTYAPQDEKGKLGSPVIHHYDVNAQVGG